MLPNAVNAHSPHLVRLGPGRRRVPPGTLVTVNASQQHHTGMPLIFEETDLTFWHSSVPGTAAVTHIFTSAQCNIEKVSKEVLNLFWGRLLGGALSFSLYSIFGTVCSNRLPCAAHLSSALLEFPHQFTFQWFAQQHAQKCYPTTPSPAR